MPLVRMRTWMAVAIATCELLAFGAARIIWEFPEAVRESNVARVSRSKCDECVTMEDFFGSNRLVFLLFYERALMNQHQYKSTVIAGFYETCRSLAFSHVACGVVDLVEDKVYAEKYIDPKTAPAHIIVREAAGVALHKHHIERLMQRPGNKEAVLWHLGDVLAMDSSPQSLHISAEAKTPADLKKLLSLHATTVVVAGKNFVDSVRAAAQRIVLQGRAHDVLAPDADSPASGKGQAKKKSAKKLPGHKAVFFVVVSGAKALKQYDLKEGTVCVYAGASRRIMEPTAMDEKVLSNEEELLKGALWPALQKAFEETGVLDELQAADKAKAAKEKAAQVDSSDKEPAKEGAIKRRRRRAGKAGASTEL